MPIIIEFAKFVEYNLKKRISDRTNKRLLIGTFTDDTGRKCEEEFMAYELQKCSAFEVYEYYISWFNYTRKNEFEKERIPVSAKWSETD